jgi:hypothetical protein
MRLDGEYSAPLHLIYAPSFYYDDTLTFAVHGNIECLNGLSSGVLFCVSCDPSFQLLMGLETSPGGFELDVDSPRPSSPGMSVKLKSN